MGEAVGTRLGHAQVAEAEAGLRDRFEGALLGAALAGPRAAAATLALAEALAAPPGARDAAIAARAGAIAVAHPAACAAPIGLAALGDRAALLERARAQARLTHGDALAEEDAALVAAAVALNCRTARFVLSYYIDNLLEHCARAGGSQMPLLSRIPERALAAAAPEAEASPVLTALAAFARSPLDLEATLAGCARAQDRETAAAVAGALVGSLAGARALPPGRCRRLALGPALRRAAAALERGARA
jgi:hypothetical protein